MGGGRKKNALFVDPTVPSVVKITMEDGSYRKIMIHPSKRIVDVIEAVLSKSNLAHLKDTYVLAFKEKGSKAVIELAPTDSARAISDPAIETVYLREVYQPVTLRRPPQPTPQAAAAAALQPAVAQPPPSGTSALTSPQQSYADHDDADDPMYDEITDIIAGKGGKADDYMYDERTMPQFKQFNPESFGGGKGGSPNAVRAANPSPDRAKQPQPTGDLHWGEGYLATGGENSPAGSRRTAPPARTTSLKKSTGNPYGSATGVPDLSSDDLYATVPMPFVGGGVVDDLQYDQSTLPEYKGDIPPPPPDAPPPDGPSPISRPRANRAIAGDDNMKGTEEYGLIDGDDGDGDGDWEDCSDNEDGDQPTVLIKVYVAKRGYTATDDDELSFKEGEQIFVAREDDDGWWLAVAQSDGSVGYVPNTFLMDRPIDEFRQEMPEELVGMDEDGDDDDDENLGMVAEEYQEDVVNAAKAKAEAVRRNSAEAAVDEHRTLGHRGTSMTIENTVSSTDADTGECLASMLPPPPAAAAARSGTC